jgi:hypothetical protein
VDDSMPLHAVAVGSGLNEGFAVLKKYFYAPEANGGQFSHCIALYYNG